MEGSLNQRTSNIMDHARTDQRAAFSADQGEVRGWNQTLREYRPREGNGDCNSENKSPKITEMMGLTREQNDLV